MFFVGNFLKGSLFTMQFDNLCKYLSEKYPERIASWVMGIPCGSTTVLKTELSIEPIRADSLTLLEVQGCILHLEFQVDFTDPTLMPLRMLDYWVRLHRKYRIPIIQVVIALKDSLGAQRLPEEFLVGETRHRYRVIRLWEQDPELFLHDPTLLPFAVLTRTDSPENLLKQVVKHVKTWDNPIERREISACSRILAGLRFSEELIRREFGLEDIMRESVVYQSIMQEGWQKGHEVGREEGRQEGEQKGLLRGRQEGELSMMLNILTSRWGQLPGDLVANLNSLSIERIEELSRVVFDLKDMQALADWLEHRTNRL